MVKNQFFVIDGTDGSGKGTQSKLIIERLKKEGYDVLEVDFPQYGQKSAALVEEYLNGKFGEAEEVTPYQASIFYAVDRFEASKKMKSHLQTGGIIISNRYVSSNQIHQSGKIKDIDELNKFLDWLDNLEFEIFKIPKPDKVFFLNMPYLIGQELVSKKEERKYIEGGKSHDIHESSKEHLKDAYERACYLAKKFDYWREIKCVENEKDIRTIEDIHEEIYNLIKKELE